MFENSLFSIVNEPTRITENTATILDQILTNLHSGIDCAIITHPVSDHLAILMSCVTWKTHVLILLSQDDCLLKKNWFYSKIIYKVLTSAVLSMKMNQIMP